MSETGRVLYRINMRNSAARWLPLQEYINAWSSECQISVCVFYFKVQRCRRGGTYHDTGLEYKHQHHYHHHLYLADMELHHFLAYSIFIDPLVCSQAML